MSKTYKIISILKIEQKLKKKEKYEAVIEDILELCEDTPYNVSHNELNDVIDEIYNMLDEVLLEVK